jgi:hypothetical protein
MNIDTLSGSSSSNLDILFNQQLNEPSDDSDDDEDMNINWQSNDSDKHNILVYETSPLPSPQQSLPPLPPQPTFVMLLLDRIASKITRLQTPLIKKIKKKSLKKRLRNETNDSITQSSYSKVKKISKQQTQKSPVQLKEPIQE